MEPHDIINRSKYRTVFELHWTLIVIQCVVGLTKLEYNDKIKSI